VQLLDGDLALAQQTVAEMGSNPVTTFVTLLAQEGQRQQSTATGNANVVDDNQCRR
jgi:hypothetical protein